MRADGRRSAVAIVAPEGYPVPPLLGGAVQTWIAEIGPRLAGREVTVISPSHPGLPAEELIGGARHRRVAVPPLRRAGTRLLPARRNWKLSAERRAYVDSVARMVRGFQGTILVGNRPQFVRRLRQAAPRARIVLRLDNLHLEDVEALSVCDALAPCSAFVATAAAAAAPDVELHVVRNGVDVNALRPFSADERAAARASLGLPRGPVFLFVGRLVPEKGAHLLVEAAPALLERHPEASVILVGSARFGLGTPTPYERELAERAAALGHRVRMTGFVPRDRLGPFWAAADAFCGPSLWDEPFGLVFLESMASGIPPIGTNRGGIPEVVVDERTGLLLPPCPTTAELSERLLRLAGDDELRARLGRAGRARAENGFSWDAMARTVEDVLD
jgi:spore coat protein SA